MDYTEAIEQAVYSRGLGSTLQIIGREPFELALCRDGEKSWWYCDSFATDAQVNRPRDNAPFRELSIKGGTFVIVYRLSAEVDVNTARSYPAGTAITAVIARKMYEPQRLLEALTSVQAIAAGS